MSSASSQVAGALDFMSASATRSVRETTGVGTCTIRRWRCCARSASSTISWCDSVLGPRSS